MNFKQWLLNETFKQTPLLKNLHDYLTKQHISDKQFMIEFLNWFDEHQDDLRELEVDWKDAKKPYVLDHETNQEYDPEEADDPQYATKEFYTSAIEMYLNDTLKLNLNKDFKHVQKIKEFLDKPENYNFLSSFKEYIVHNYINFEDSIDQTSGHRFYIFKKLLNPNNWLLHFTNNAESIKRNGFKFGVTDFDDLPLTRIYGYDRNKAGYNFAYLSKDYNTSDIPTTYLNTHDHKESPNSGLLMFKSSGVLVDNLADHNEEVIFDGSSINPKNIVVIKPERRKILFVNNPENGGETDVSSRDNYEKWIVKSQNPKLSDPFSGTIQDAIKWVKNNWNTSKNIIT